MKLKSIKKYLLITDSVPSALFLMSIKLIKNYTA